MARPDPPQPSQRQRTLILPHFACEIPLLAHTDGLHYVPVALLCRLLGLDPAHELPRARRVLLWDSARLLPLRLGALSCRAWCLPYPLDVGYWFGQVAHRVRDPERRAQLERAIDDAMRLSALAHSEVERRFADGRRRMYRLAGELARLRGLCATLLGRPAVDAAQGDPGVRARRAALRHAALADQAETFVRAWLADKAELPIVDGIRVDEAGDIVESSVAMTLLGTITAEEQARLARYEEACAAALAELMPLAGSGD